MIAYLNTEYPSLSHTFIEREIRALRRLGIEIQPFSIRRTRPTGPADSVHAQAARETVYILDGLFRLIVVALWAAVCSPVRGLVTLLKSQQLSPPGVKSRALHIVYALEGIRLGRELHQRRIRHVHVHMANNGTTVAMLACAFNQDLSYSLTVHGSAEFFHVDTWRLKAKVEGALFVRCISNFCRAQVMAWTAPEAWTRIHVVHCGIDTTHFGMKTHSVCPVLRLIAIGRLHPIKGYSLLIRACAALSARQIPWSLNIVGDGPLRRDLHALVDELHIGTNVIFSGAVPEEDVPSLLADADVLVVSSFMEGLPVVIMEAMAVGLPVLSTNVAGIPEIVDPGIHGELVSPGSVESLTEGLIRLHGSRDRFEEIGKMGRDRVVREYSIETVGAEMANLFRKYQLLPSDRQAT